MIRLKENEFTDIVEYMRMHYGINLEKKKILIECRMSKTLEKQGLSSFGSYMELLKKDRTEKIAAELILIFSERLVIFKSSPVKSFQNCFNKNGTDL